MAQLVLGRMCFILSALCKKKMDNRIIFLKSAKKVVVNARSARLENEKRLTISSLAVTARSVLATKTKPDSRRGMHIRPSCWSRYSSVLADVSFQRKILQTGPVGVRAKQNASQGDLGLPQPVSSHKIHMSRKAQKVLHSA